MRSAVLIPGGGGQSVRWEKDGRSDARGVWKPSGGYFAAIGPSICQDCYEVGKDVAEPFEKLFSQERYQDVSMKNILTEKVNGKYQLDLWRANEAILLGAGILKEHLSMTDICTCCNPSYLFSHRASKGKRGNLAAFLMLKQ